MKPTIYTGLKGASHEIEMDRIWYQMKDLEKLELRGWFTLLSVVCVQRFLQILSIYTFILSPKLLQNINIHYSYHGTIKHSSLISKAEHFIYIWENTISDIFLAFFITKIEITRLYGRWVAYFGPTILIS